MGIWAPHICSQILNSRKLQATAHTAWVSYSFRHLQTRFSFLGCLDSTEDITSTSGKLVWLKPSNIPTKNVTVRWKIQLDSSGKKEILTWKSYSNSLTISSDFNNIYYFNTSDFTLGLKSAKLNDSGLYELETTKSSGAVCTKKFQILILGEFLALFTLPL